MVEQIGTCRVLGEIGSGGMAVVYEAIQEPLNRRVAIKALKPSIAIDGNGRVVTRSVSTSFRIRN